MPQHDSDYLVSFPGAGQKPLVIAVDEKVT